MRVKVILNPQSGRGKAGEQYDTIADVCRQYGTADLEVTRRPGHARELARAAVESGYELVVAVGGDGTVHEVVNGLVRGDKADLPLGIIPLGSGNDLAWALGIPMDPAAALARLFNDNRRTIDLVRIEDDHGRTELFQNNLGIGFDAMVVIRSKAISRVKGFAMYLTAVLQSILLNFDTPQLDIDFDEEKVSQKALFLTLGNGPRGGGGFLVVPAAEMDDGLLDSCLVNPMSRTAMLYMLTKVMNGSHVTSDRVTMRQNRRIKVHSSMPMPIHLDGEMFAYPGDNIRTVTIEILPAAIQVVV